jgi:hypothetical protein
MSSSENADPASRQAFIDALLARGEAIKVPADYDLNSPLPAGVTHVLYPDGTLRRVRFA